MRRITRAEEYIVDAVENGYTVDDGGCLINPKGKKPKTRIDNTGYPTVTLGPVYDRMPIKVHRIAAYILFGEIIFDSKTHVRHLDGDKTNNKPSNLQIGTQSENMLDRPRKERLEHARRASTFNRKLTDQQVENLRKDRAVGLTYRQLCGKYGISKSQVSYIVRRLSRNW